MTLPNLMERKITSDSSEETGAVIFLSIICHHTKFQGGADLPPSPDIRDRREESEKEAGREPGGVGWRWVIKLAGYTGD